MPDLSQMKPAMFRNLPFAVLTSGGEHGRRSETHEYPDKDIPWVEDLGRKARLIRFRGFLLSNSRVYGGGDVADQLKQMIGAAETKGTGPLVHPLLGNLTVSCRLLSYDAGLDGANYIEISFELVEGGVRTFPSTTVSTGTAVTAAAQTATTSTSSGLVTALGSGPLQGAAVAQSALMTVQSWAQSAVLLAGDATSLLNMVSGLPGNNGRYANAGNLGGFGVGLNSSVAAGTTVAMLVVQAASLQGAVAAAATALETAATADLASDPGSIADAAASVVQAVSAAAQNPSDGMRLLSQLATPVTVVATGSSVIATAMATVQGALGDMLRRSAVVAVAQAATAYQPSSYDGAIAVMQQVTALLDAEILIAGDQGEDDVYESLWSLRATVVQDLMARGADLAAIATFTFKANLPALVLAQRLYADPTRTAELITQVNPIHPLFMPTTFQALAS